jgi:hypothetical protein
VSTAATVIKRLAAVRAQLDAAGNLLLAPKVESVDRCSALLETAGLQMAELRPDWAGGPGDAAALEEAWRVRRSFVRAARLLESAVRFHENWAAIRGAMTGGYTNRGEPAPVVTETRVFLEA